MQSEEVRMACGNRTAIRQRWQECQQDIVRGISDILRRGVSMGAIRKDIPTETMAVCLLAMLRSLTWQSQTGLDKEQPTTVLTDLFLQGAGAPAKAAERRSGDGRKPRRGGTINKAG
jgi:hypothetical protein